MVSYVVYSSYQNSPDLRLTWLQHMAQKHNEVMHICDVTELM